MKFFWKLFCSIIIITALTCSVGGYFLIRSQFQMSLEREISMAYVENDILWQFMDRELQNLNTSAPVGSQISALASNITINTSGGKMAFTVSDGEGLLLYSNSGLSGSASVYKGILPNTRGYEIYSDKEDYYIHMVRAAAVQEQPFFLENFREITYLFDAKKSQHTFFAFLMIILFAAVGLMTFLVCSMLLSPLKKLSAATRQMANGKFGQHFHVKSQDEIGELAQDFEQMSLQLDDMVNKLKDYSLRQRDFVNNFSHELKTPLTSIIGYADMLRSKNMTPERSAACANYIFTEGKRLEALSKKLMEMIVLEKQDFPLRPVSMKQFLEQIGEEFKPVYAELGISFTVTAQEAVAQLEPDLMKTVLFNLLDNARKAVDGKGAIILGGTCLTGNIYCIFVKDDGKGIPSEDIPKVTEAFYMADKSRARAQGGAGLGLALSSRIISIHHGRMEITCPEEGGTCISLYLNASPSIALSTKGEHHET